MTQPWDANRRTKVYAKGWIQGLSQLVIDTRNATRNVSAGREKMVLA
jgi:hypothetical protein